MRELSELVPDVSIAASGAPGFVVLHALARSTAEFLYRTEAWKEWSIDTDPADIASGEYTWLNHLDPDAVDAADFDYLRVKRVKQIQWGVNGRMLRPLTEAQLSDRDPDWRDAEGTPYTYVSLSDEGGGVRFVPAPTSDGLPDAMRAQLVMITEVTSGVPTSELNALIPSIPTRLFRQYREVLVSGALAILYAIPNRDWSNPALSVLKRNEFDNGVILAESAAARDENRVQVTTNFNPDW